MVLLNNDLLIVIFFTFNRITTHSIAISYNRPKLCPNATWSSTPVDIPNNFGAGSHVNSLFINTKNTIYVSEKNSRQIYAWSGLNSYSSQASFIFPNDPYALFVTDTDDIYVDIDNPNRVEKTTISSTGGSIVMNNTGRCAGLFIDINNTLYCSITNQHQVLAKSLNSMTSAVATVAGTGSYGSSPNMLYGPCGIFVTITFRLYVAECGSNRIQFFELGSLNGTTVGPSGIPLDCPTGVILDADDNLYIVDKGGDRVVQYKFGQFSIIGNSPYNSGGSGKPTPTSPETISFDSYGNIYVPGRGSNGRILKYNLTTNFCDQLTTTQRLQTTDESIAITTSILNSTISTAIQLTSTSDTIPTDSFSFSSTIPSSLSVFLPFKCPNSTNIGIHCNISSTPCDIPDLCQNNSTCENINSTYICHCLPGFNGTECQYDYRPCPPNKCWNNGICNKLSNTTFNCTCAMNWTGVYCERMINHCENVICENGGVCRSLLGDYQCECLGKSYSGRHCEIKATALVIRKVVSKSFASIAIIGMLSIVIFIITMDIMKYCFNIDPIHGELERIRRKKRRFKKPKKLIIQRFVYKDTSPILNP